MPPDYFSFHKSIADELYSLKDRIRNLVHHWPTDGEWKEVALRNLLRKHLPASVAIGSGFIVTPQESSSQVDILVIDTRKPTLFRDGDLFIVTPDSVLAAIEVKTQQTGTHFEETLTKLAKVEELCRTHNGASPVWTGLFTFNENDVTPEGILKALAKAESDTHCAINCVAAGRNVFVRYWNNVDPTDVPQVDIWRSYKLNGTAPSYFLGNLIDWISRVDHAGAQFAWFPEPGGKEGLATHFIEAGNAEARRIL